MLPCYGKRKKFVKIQDLKISKHQKSNFVRILESKIQEMFEKIQKRFVGGVAFYNFYNLQDMVDR